MNKHLINELSLFIWKGNKFGELQCEKFIKVVFVFWCNILIFSLQLKITY